MHRDLRAVPGLPGERGDLDGAVGDLRHLQREQFAHQIGVRAGQLDLGLADPAADADDVAAQPVAVLVALAGHLFGRPDHAVGALGLGPDPHHHVAAGVLPRVALHDAGHDIALVRGELAVHPLVLGIAQSLQDHLARRGGRDASETLWGVVPFVDEVAVAVTFAGDHLHHAGLAVDVDAGVGLMAFGMSVGRQQRRLDGLDDDVDRDSLVGFDGV